MKRTFLSALILFLPFLLQAQYVTELHYDNTGGDVGEFVEIYIPNTFTGNLSDLTVSLINGNDCVTAYNSITADLMTAGATDTGGTYYTWYPTSIQNGAPDGVQVDDAGMVIDFITYEGTCPNAIDIGVAEAGAIGESLQLVGGVWIGPVAESPGQPNASVTSGCTDATACNYNMAATLDDGSCYSIGDACDDMDLATSLDVYIDCNTCQGTSGLSTCFTDNCSFEIVPVSINAELDNWVCDSTMTYSANGFTGTTGETSDLWLILGNYDLSSTTSFYLNLDAVENFSGSGLEIFYSNAYAGCPSDASNAWSSAGVIPSGSGGTGLVFDLSSAGGLNSVYIGIQYLSGSGGGEASGWNLSNISLSADICPSSSAPITSMCSGLFDCPTLMANIGSLCDDMNPMTLNDTISPSCTCVGTMVASNCPNAAITEFGYDCDNGDMNEVLEVVIPNSFTGNLADLQIDLYNGSNNLVYSTITLDNFTAGTNTGTNTFYYWNGTGSSIQNGPDGIALSYLGLTCQFISYEDTLLAADGPAVGMNSIDVLVNQTNTTTCDETIQAFGGLWVNACATIGMTNSDAACPITFDCPTQMVNFGDTCNDMLASTYNDIIQMDCSCAGTAYDCTALNLNFGDPCDDMNAATFNDVVQMDCSCAGVGAGTCPTGAFVSELHYNNAGTDSLEFVEIAVPIGDDATQIIIDLYNGSNGASYNNYALTAADLISSDATYDYYVWSPTSIQNGPDGIAISCVNGVLISFISYGGSFAATAGSASGSTSTNIGVTEGSGTATQSLQYDGMMWGFDCTATPGMANDLSTCGMIGGCIDSLYVPGSISAGLYEANITTFSDGTIIPTNTVTFHADNYVELRPNFDVPLNTQFTAAIQPCGTPAAAKPTDSTTTPTKTIEAKEEE